MKKSETTPVVMNFGVRKRSPLGPLAGSLGITLALFALLPFTQLIANIGKNKTELTTVDVSLPPPPPPPPEPPPPENEQEEEPPPDMQKQQQPLSLSQMDLALNLGVGDAMQGAFSFEGFGVQPDAVSDLEIFDVKDLDRPPKRIKTVPPVYPPALKRARVTGEVKLLIIIDQSGRVKVERTLNSTAREFEQAAIRAAQECLFEPPTKGGKKVRARYSMDVPFRF